MVPPGVPVPLARLLTMVRLTVPAVGVATLPHPTTVEGPDRAQAVLLTADTPAGSAGARSTAKYRVTVPSGPMLPAGSRQSEPAEPAGQTQPGDEAAASKTVYCGISSVSCTPPSPRPLRSVAEMV